jgi:uncharacterized membrane protein (DUF106 family)
MDDNFFEKFFVCRDQSRWLEKRIEEFNKKISEAQSEEEKQALFPEGVEILNLINQEIKEIEKLTDA